MMFNIAERRAPVHVPAWGGLNCTFLTCEASVVNFVEFGVVVDLDTPVNILLVQVVASLLPAYLSEAHTKHA